MKVSLSFLFDTALSFFVVFILSLLFLSYYTPRPYSIIFSAVFALLFSIIIGKKLLKKDNEKRQTAKDEREKNKMCAQFNFASKCEVNDFFEKVMKGKGYKTERKKSGIFIKDKAVAIFIFFGFIDVNKTQIVKVFNSISSSEKAFVLSEKFSQEIFAFAKRFDGRIILKDANSIYAFLKENNSLPPEKYEFSDKKLKGLTLLKTLLEKKKAKRFFAFGFIFLAFSYFVPIKVYYVVFGCAFLIFALFLTIFGQTENN